MCIGTSMPIENQSRFECIKARQRNTANLNSKSARDANISQVHSEAF